MAARAAAAVGAAVVFCDNRPEVVGAGSAEESGAVLDGAVTRLARLAAERAAIG